LILKNLKDLQSENSKNEQFTADILTKTEAFDMLNTYSAKLAARRQPKSIQNGRNST